MLFAGTSYSQEWSGYTGSGGVASSYSEISYEYYREEIKDFY